MRLVKTILLLKYMLI